VTGKRLSLVGISKHFGSTTALSGVDFSLAPGEIHALLGENGAGKSTLMGVAYGMIAPDAGTIRVRGREMTLRSPREARNLGIGMVHQHFTSIGALTVRENLELAVGKRMAGPLDGWTAAGLLRGLEPEGRVAGLSVALRQRLEIAKALAAGADMLLLDEPNAVLTPGEVEEQLGRVREFVGNGGAAALITHKLAEVFAAADRVTVLRHGVVTLHGLVRDQTERGLAEAMIGDALAVVPGSARPADCQTGTVPAVRIGEISVYPGELIGLAAIEGQGHRELLRRIAGVTNTPGYRAPFETPGGPISATGPVAFVPEDRTTEGLIPEMSLAENVALGHDTDPRWARGGWVRWRAVREHAALLVRSFRIRAPSVDAAAAVLSGGNQQKLMLARALESRPRVLVVENPTRGLDIRATAEIQDRLRSAAGAGVAVLVYSGDLDEVLALADRALVVREGRVTEAPHLADRRVVGEMMLGVAVNSEQ